MENNLWINIFRRHSLVLFIMFCLLAVPSSGDIQTGTSDEESSMESLTIFLIEDFSREDGLSPLGTKWKQYTDQVMGGESTATYTIEIIEGQRCIHLQGDVSLENRGGFIQVALPLKKNGRPVNASQFEGVRLWVRGNGETYYVHLRTSSTWLPWQYYEAPFFADDQWREVRIPFIEFKPERLKTKLKTKKMKRLAIVAAHKAFKANIAVSRIEFYRINK
jgi:hypothetical protein